MVRRGYRFWAGIEGRIHVQQHNVGLDRCRDHGAAGMERWVSWDILTHGLATIAQTVTHRSGKRPAKTP